MILVFETMIGNYYFTGHEILSRLYKEMARDVSTRKGLWSPALFERQFPCLPFSVLEEEGAGPRHLTWTALHFE